jgi:hypothetical protein
MMTYLFMFVYIVIIVLLMVLEIYSIYEYRTCTNYDNRPYYNDCVFICDNRPYYNDYVFIHDLLSLFE